MVQGWRCWAKETHHSSLGKQETGWEVDPPEVLESWEIGHTDKVPGLSQAQPNVIPGEQSSFLFLAQELHWYGAPTCSPHGHVASRREPLSLLPTW